MDSTFISDLAATVDIPADGTLSRVVFSSDRARVVAFAFDTGQELTEHTAKPPVIVQLLRGRIDFGVAEATHAMVPGSWIHLDGGVPHSVLALEPSIMVLTLLPGG